MSPGESAGARSVVTEGRWFVLLTLAALFYVAVTLIFQGAWLIEGPMWAEMASNYYPNAQSGEWLVRLFATDAGYIPLPQRLIALVGAIAHLPAAWVPFYDSGASIGLGALLVASFCHRAFRPLITNDRLRFLVCVVFALAPDFQTRVFISFTYLGLALAIPLVALALARPDADAPGWAWVLPLLMLSKPVFLALVPAMLLAAFFARPRFRLLMIVCVLTGVAQVARLVLSGTAGPNSETFVDPEATIASRLVTAIIGGCGLMAQYVLGPSPGQLISSFSPLMLVAVGAVLTGIVLAVLGRYRRVSTSAPTSALVLVGVSVVFGASLLNSVALSSSWNTGLYFLRDFSTDRSVFGGIAGAVFVMAGLAWLLLGRVRSFGPLSPAVLALLWLIGSGWPIVAARARLPPFPSTGVSSWMAQADRIDRPGTTVCVPADPYEFRRWFFMYGRGCAQLTLAPPPDAPGSVPSPGVTLDIPPAARDHPIVGLLVLVRTAAGLEGQDVHVLATGVTASGADIVFEGHRRVGPAPGLIVLMPTTVTPRALTGVRLETRPPSEIVQGTDGQPGVAYLGGAELQQ